MDIAPINEKTGYVRWMKSQGPPIHIGHGMADLRTLEVAPYRRTGGKVAFIHLHGMQGITGGYIGEIPPGDALKPERHLYEEVICILNGQGATEIWDDHGHKKLFEWGKWSLFAPPMNTSHRLVNGSREPVRFLAVTNAPLAFDIYRDENFIFNCPYSFSDRYSGADGFFNVGQKRYESGMQHIWETNFIMDIQSANLDQRDVKGAGVRITQFELSGNSLIGHLAQWPAGRYHKAHYHGAGAILLGLQSSGYVLLWSKELGIHPYESGRGDEVVEVKWKPGSVYCPPGGWFHQHFNTGAEPARHLAIRYGSRLHPIGFKIADKRSEDGVYIDVKRGGTLIEYADEDPHIRRHYEEELKRTGVACQMPPA